MSSLDWNLFRGGEVPAHIAATRAERAADPHFQTWRLCLDCAGAPDDEHHVAGYRMARVPFDIPAHAYIAPPEPTPPADDLAVDIEAPEYWKSCDCGKGEWCPETGAAFKAAADEAAARGHDPSGRACALAGRVLRGDDKPGIGECEACISDSVPPMTSEVDLSDARLGTLAIDGTAYEVQRNPGGPHGVWFILTGPRGAVSGLMPYVEQPTPGVLHLFPMNTRAHTPHYAAGKSFLFVAGRLGYIR